MSPYYPPGSLRYRRPNNAVSIGTGSPPPGNPGRTAQTVAVVQRQTATVASGTSVTATLGSSLTPGNIILCIVGSATKGISALQYPAGTTPLINTQGSGNVRGLTYCYREIKAGFNQLAWTVASGSGVATLNITVMELSGADITSLTSPGFVPGTVIEQTPNSVNNVATTAHAPPASTPVITPGAMAIATWQLELDGGASVSLADGFTELDRVSSTMQVASKSIASAPASLVPSWTWTNTSKVTSGYVVIRAAQKIQRRGISGTANQADTKIMAAWAHEPAKNLVANSTLCCMAGSPTSGTNIQMAESWQFRGPTGITQTVGIQNATESAFQIAVTGDSTITYPTLATADANNLIHAEAGESGFFQKLFTPVVNPSDNITVSGECRIVSVTKSGGTETPDARARIGLYAVDYGDGLITGAPFAWGMNTGALGGTSYPQTWQRVNATISGLHASTYGLYVVGRIVIASDQASIGAGNTITVTGEFRNIQVEIASSATAWEAPSTIAGNRHLMIVSGNATTNVFDAVVPAGWTKIRESVNASGTTTVIYSRTDGGRTVESITGLASANYSMALIELMGAGAPQALDSGTGTATAQNTGAGVTPAAGENLVYGAIDSADHAAVITVPAYAPVKVYVSRNATSSLSRIMTVYELQQSSAASARVTRTSSLSRAYAGALVTIPPS